MGPAEESVGRLALAGAGRVALDLDQRVGPVEVASGDLGAGDGGERLELADVLLVHEAGVALHARVLEHRPLFDDRVLLGRVDEDHLLDPVLAGVEVIDDAFLLHQPMDEVEVALLVLDRVLALRVRAHHVDLDVAAVGGERLGQHLLEHGGGGLLLEDARVATVAERGQGRLDHRRRADGVSVVVVHLHRRDDPAVDVLGEVPPQRERARAAQERQRISVLQLRLELEPDEVRLVQRGADGGAQHVPGDAGRRIRVEHRLDLIHAFTSVDASRRWFIGPERDARSETVGVGVGAPGPPATSARRCPRDRVDRPRDCVEPSPGRVPKLSCRPRATEPPRWTRLGSSGERRASFPAVAEETGWRAGSTPPHLSRIAPMRFAVVRAPGGDDIPQMRVQGIESTDLTSGPATGAPSPGIAGRSARSASGLPERTPRRAVDRARESRAG